MKTNSISNQQTKNNPKLISANELAEILNISPRTIWRLVSSGKMLKPIRIGGNVRWRLDQINSWIENGCPIPIE